MSAQSPDLSIDRGIPRLGLGCHVQPLGPPLPSATVAGALAKKGPNRATAHMQALVARWYRQGEREERNRSERKASIKRVREIV